MGRRRKDDFAGAEAIVALAALSGLLWFFSPGFRFLIQILLLVLVIVVLLVVAIWFAYKAFKSELPSHSLKTSEWKPNRTQSPTIKPPTIGEELQHAGPIPELTISEKLHKIDWFQFEKLIELIYLRRGFTVKRLGGAHPDGGVDLIIESPTEKFVVQCKHWRKCAVGVRHIREFLGTMMDSKISKGIFITLTGYSGEAKQLADKHGIQILNESDLVKILNERDHIYSEEISALFSDTRKFCPKCENELVLRTVRLAGNQFWGCSTYPRCKFTMKFDGEL
jgi:HJR/Mrr/RecB family endonuclease